MAKRKQQTNEQKIVAALDALDKSVSNLQKFGARYDVYIDEAGLSNDNVKVKQLIKQKLRVYDLIKQLNMLRSNIELGIYTSQAISELGKLPDAIAGVKGLLAESPDFTKLGKSITTIFNDISKSESELSKLNEILDPKPTEGIISRLSGAEHDEIENSDQFKTEYAAMIERIKPKLYPETVAKPASSTETETGDIDYEGIIKIENNKKD